MRYRRGLAWLVLGLVGCSSATSPTSQPQPSANVIAAEPSALPAATSVPTLAATLQPSPAVSSQVLPQPLYALSSQPNGVQIVRLETDGKTLTPITNEQNGVFDYQISSLGQIAYIANNDLILVDALGQNREILVDGPTIDPQADTNVFHRDQLNTPRWSPDGSSIAFSWGGLQVLSLIDRKQTMLQPHTSNADAALADIYAYSVLYGPNSWSPDGSKILATAGFVPEGGNLVLFDLASSAPLTITINGNYPCCHVSWEPDGSAINVTNETFGIFPTGWWHINPSTGESKALIDGDNVAPFQPVSSVFMQPDGSHLGFVGTIDSNDPMEISAPLTLSQIGVDGSIMPLRQDSQTVGSVLWAPDGSGAVIVPSMMAETQLQWIPSNGSPIADLALSGANMQWAIALDQ
ncbi:hypothetical protein [Herpetosiphon geysericola]|uniref:Lipoprotein LpqB beta-propeller domain-containing protein n=1 Tax=Herpetosiphon geysericola TaxID=70996 RepID=A0A0P6YC08_9CHLR|nr:hypothetical protein [Herpetosiphon geysericola]KPL87046.1 hypothetical protein SE18_11180 [Herpetosiphon geysericola]